MKNTNEHLGKMIKIALLGAIAAVLMCLEIPFPTTTWLKIDFGELPALIGGLAFGPLAAIVIQTLKIALKLLIMGTHTGFVGEIANYIIGLFFVIPASLIRLLNISVLLKILSFISASTNISTICSFVMAS